MNFEEKLKKWARGRAFFYSFTNVEWANRTSALKDLGFIYVDELKLFEIEKKEAKNSLIVTLSTDLCYGSKIMSLGQAKELAEEFISQQDKQARFFTNSSVPYSKKENAWSFNSITEATIDTGVIVKLGKQLVSILWIGDID